MMSSPRSGHDSQVVSPVADIDQSLAAQKIGDILRLLGGGQGSPNDAINNVAATSTGGTTSSGSTVSSGAHGSNTDPNAIEAFLAATRQHESGGDYTIYNQSGLSNASGAYQFIGSTWRGAGGSTQNAAEASPEEQDRVARSMAQSLFDQFHDWRLVAIAWYGGPGVAEQVANGQDPGSPDQQGGYLAYGDTIVNMMAGGQ